MQFTVLFRLGRQNSTWNTPQVPTVAVVTTEDTMAGENRTPDKTIGEVQHAQEQTDRTTGHKTPHGPGAADEKEAVRAKPEQDPQKKKTGEF